MQVVVEERRNPRLAAEAVTAASPPALPVLKQRPRQTREEPAPDVSLKERLLLLASGIAGITPSEPKPPPAPPREKPKPRPRVHERASAFFD